MEKELVLCDTNIFIEFYRDNKEIISNLGKLGSEKICLSVITAGELIFGAINKKDLHIILQDISNLKLIEINDLICKSFIELMTKYCLSNKLSLPDAMIAATCLVYNVPLYTLNKRDFRNINGIKFWD
jgi:tRNA(fMet)-specific endonuclease VapC